MLCDYFLHIVRHSDASSQTIDAKFFVRNNALLWIRHILNDGICCVQFRSTDCSESGRCGNYSRRLSAWVRIHNCFLHFVSDQIRSMHSNIVRQCSCLSDHFGLFLVPGSGWERYLRRHGMTFVENWWAQFGLRRYWPATFDVRFIFMRQMDMRVRWTCDNRATDIWKSFLQAPKMYFPN